MKSFAITRHIDVWLITAANAVQETFVNRWTNALFFLGKSIRFGVSLFVLLLIKQNTSQIGPYSTDQMIVFFLTYQFLDTSSQIAYRGVYLFGNLVKNGEFDFYLSKPINPLFRALTGKPDINDIFFLIPSTLLSIYIVLQLDITITLVSFLWFLLLLCNAYLIITALHIMVMVIGILTVEVDGVIWMYRDLIRLGQFPISLYNQPLRFALFFIIPVGMMITIPVEKLLSSPTSFTLPITFLIGIGSLLISLRSWKFALKRYSSASS